MYRLKKRQMGLLLIIFVLFLLINVGYAYLRTDLNISGSTTVNSFSFDVHWSNDSYTPEGEAWCSTSIDGDTFNFDSSLTLPGDSCTFTVDIVNSGSLPASISLSSGGSDFSFPYSYNGDQYDISASYSGPDFDHFESNNNGTITIEVTRGNCDEYSSSCDSGSGSFSIDLSAVQTSTN